MTDPQFPRPDDAATPPGPPESEGPTASASPPGGAFGRTGADRPTEPVPTFPIQPPASTTPDPSPTPTGQPASEWYSPAPERRVDWSRPEFADREHDLRSTPWTAQPTAHDWYAPTAPVARHPEPRGPRRGAAVGTVLAAALISAVLASGGTFLALDASGSLDHPTPIVATTPGADTAGTHPSVTINESSAVIDAAAKVGPAVVTISTGASGSSQLDPFSSPDAGVGSGFIYDSNGWILTNHHVVGTSSSVSVKLQNGHTYTGTVYGIDTLTDLAIVKVDATGLPSAPLGDSDALKVGQLTVAIGSPLGTYSNSVTSGILSAKGRTIQVDGGQLNNLLQTDTAINPGNSGGPLIDALGDVIGINTAIATSAQGIGFAIPINLAKPIMRQAVNGQQLARPFIGVRFEMIDYQLAKDQNLPVQQGAWLTGGTDATGQQQPAVTAEIGRAHV